MRPKGSEKTRGSGRTKGTPNRITRDVRLVAREFTAEAIRTLASIMRRKTAHDQARVAAAKELLDRGWGKPTQPVDGQLVVGISAELRRFIERNAAAQSRNFLGFDGEADAHQDDDVRH
jgi:hypothetical protein